MFFARVIYLTDKYVENVPASFVSNFKPKDEGDFDPNQVYHVFWTAQDDMETHYKNYMEKAAHNEDLLIVKEEQPERLRKKYPSMDGFYKGQILKLALSVEDLIEEEESESNQDDKRPRRNIIKPTKFQKEAVEPIKPAASSTKKFKEALIKKGIKNAAGEYLSIADCSKNGARKEVDKKDTSKKSNDDRKQNETVNENDKGKSQAESDVETDGGAEKTNKGSNGKSDSNLDIDSDLDFSSDSNEDGGSVVPEKEFEKISEKYRELKNKWLEKSNKNEKSRAKSDSGKTDPSLRTASNSASSNPENAAASSSDTTNPEENGQTNSPQNVPGSSSGTNSLVNSGESKSCKKNPSGDFEYHYVGEHAIPLLRWAEINKVPCNIKGDSMYCKKFAMALWGEELKNRNNAGEEKVNRLGKLTTPLTPEKLNFIVQGLKRRIVDNEKLEENSSALLARLAKVPSYVGEKISTLNRPPQKKPKKLIGL